MQACLRLQPVPPLLLFCVLLTPFALPRKAASAQTAPEPAPSVQLTPYTTPDQTASAGVPSGWKAAGSETTITLTGPQGETIFLGRVYIARNGAFVAGQKPGGGADLSMPYNAPLTQKLSMVYQQGYALVGQPATRITFTSATPLQVPPILASAAASLPASTAAPRP